MRVRLMLAAAALVTVPLAGTSHASACNDELFPEVCAVHDETCRRSSTTREACRLFG